MAHGIASIGDCDEIELAQRCAAGDRAALQRLFQRQRAQVHRTLFRILGSNRAIEDLIQETFLSAFGSIASFRGESSLNTWIDTIAARVCYRYLSRKEPRAVHLQAVAELSTHAPCPERQASMREAVRRLYAVLDRIDPKYRIAYTLHVIDDRPMKEVAQVMRCSVIAVKNRVFRARQMVHERALRDPLLAELITRSEEVR